MLLETIEQVTDLTAPLPAAAPLLLPDLAGYLKFASHPAWFRIRLNIR